MLVAGDNDTDKVQQHYWAVNVHIFHCTKLTSAASGGLWLSIQWSSSFADSILDSQDDKLLLHISDIQILSELTMQKQKSQKCFYLFDESICKVEAPLTIKWTYSES